MAAGAVAAPAGIASAGRGGSGTAFNHVGTFSVPANLRPGEDIDTVTSAEIVDETLGGLRLVYTDSPAGRLGFVNIVQAARGEALGSRIRNA